MFGNLTGTSGDFQAMKTMVLEALTLAEELEDKVARMNALSWLAQSEPPVVNIGMMDESLAIARELGDRASIGTYMSWAAEAR